MQTDLQRLLIILDGTKLQAGYLQPSGGGTALETVMTLRQQFSPWVLKQNPLPGMNNPPIVNGRPMPNLLLSPAWMASKDGVDGIYLDGVDGGLDFSQRQPAFTILQPV